MGPTTKGKYKSSIDSMLQTVVVEVVFCVAFSWTGGQVTYGSIGKPLHIPLASIDKGSLGNFI